MFKNNNNKCCRQYMYKGLIVVIKSWVISSWSAHYKGSLHVYVHDQFTYVIAIDICSHYTVIPAATIMCTLCRCMYYYGTSVSQKWMWLLFVTFLSSLQFVSQWKGSCYDTSLTLTELYQTREKTMSQYYMYI